MISSRGLKLRLGRYQFLSNRSYTSWFTRGSFRFSLSSKHKHTHILKHDKTRSSHQLHQLHQVGRNCVCVRVHSFDLSPDYTARPTHVILRSHNT